MLLYHRVAEPVCDPLLLSVSPRNLADHLDVVAARGPIVALQEIPGAHRGVAITFDDGYADNLLAARGLAARGAPLTVFATSGAPGRPPWWDELARLVLAGRLPDAVSLGLPAGERRWTLAADEPPVTGWSIEEPVGESPRRSLYLELFRALRPLRSGARNAILGRLAEQLDGGQVEDARFLDTDELRELAGVDGVEVGGHTRTHPVLSTLAPDEQLAEIRDGKLELERAIGRPVTSFAYPFGARADYDATSVAAVRASGFERACANEPGRPRARGDRFRIPRFLVRDWDGDAFSAELDRWLA